ncbi:hypothetical protein PseudUWO311_18515 [Pseudanabaena sp. UWO311]|uniref:hypothetical protein n=1 Tax=Pseudanabaena sp. UWO311 TaxID=2487337 RepID=UPI00115B7260|nr:hypothetical protein [Pseudanabaena sp. UWO311]TYQ24578.1 hypothetical protein PseudUWO311_18515 [Pseudanabaena sp. UWO311]
MYDLKLEGEDGDLHITVDENGWAKCYLLTRDSNIFLGTDAIYILAERLILNLKDVKRKPAGELDGCIVWAVISLYEAHHTLYFYIRDEVRVLLWQDEEAKLVATTKLSEEQYGEWQRLLTDVTWNLDGRPLAASVAGQLRGDCPYLNLEGTVGAVPPCQP